MIRPYDELIDFIAAGPSSAAVASFEASQATKDRVAELIARERSGILSEGEAVDLNYFLQIEHIVRLAKARARQNCAS